VTVMWRKVCDHHAAMTTILCHHDALVMPWNYKAFIWNCHMTVTRLSHDTDVPVGNETWSWYKKIHISIYKWN
jgi:hypothetical protein